jgi:hypothetical protein
MQQAIKEDRSEIGCLIGLVEGFVLGGLLAIVPGIELWTMLGRSDGDERFYLGVAFYALCAVPFIAAIYGGIVGFIGGEFYNRWKRSSKLVPDVNERKLLENELGFNSMFFGAVAGSMFVLPVAFLGASTQSSGTLGGIIVMIVIAIVFITWGTTIALYRWDQKLPIVQLRDRHR